MWVHKRVLPTYAVNKGMFGNLPDGAGGWCRTPWLRSNACFACFCQDAKTLNNSFWNEHDSPDPRCDTYHQQRKGFTAQWHRDILSIVSKCAVSCSLVSEKKLQQWFTMWRVKERNTWESAEITRTWKIQSPVKSFQVVSKCTVR